MKEKAPTDADVVELEAQIAHLGISIFEFENERIPSGYWSIVVRKEKLLVRFFWDKRDEIMFVEETDWQREGKYFTWHPTETPDVPFDEKSEPFKYIAAVLEKKFPRNKLPSTLHKPISRISRWFNSKSRNRA